MIGTGVAVVIAAAAGWAAWAYVLRVPSPAAVCRSLYGLVQGNESTDAGERLAMRVAPYALEAADPQAKFNETCGVFFTALVDDKEYGKATRCMTTSWSAEAASDCFDHRFYTKPGSVAVREKLAAELAQYPDEAPALPDGLDAAYAQLVEVSIAALGQCDAIWDADDGCYNYLAAFGAENRRELAVPIPGPVPDSSSGLVLLEAKCKFDVARWTERNPQLGERLANAPIPAQSFACHYLPSGDLREGFECTQWEPASSDASVGRPGRAGARIRVPMAPECADRVVRIEIEREDGEGRSVELAAYFKGSDYRAPTVEPIDGSDDSGQW